MNHRLLVLLVLAAVLVAGEASPGTTLNQLRPHLMLGVAPAPGSQWMDETIRQGARWDVRYIYLPGNVNTPGDRGWLDSDAAARRHAQYFLDESERWGTIPCFTWYKICYAAPGLPETGGDAWLREARQVKSNLANAATMRAYFNAIAALMRLSGQYRKPVIFHHEPDMWGFFDTSPVFAPNTAEGTYVAVAACGLPELAGLPDNAGGLGQAIVRLRNQYAPNVILGWHASLWEGFDPRRCAKLLAACGAWDLIFTDPSDRDSGFKIANNYYPQHAWWDERLFERFQGWTKDLHLVTGRPMVLWQIPLGNTQMAACNDSQGHYQDNRVQTLIGGYPSDGKLAEWRDAGVVMLLFGAGAAGVTNFEDQAKDGINNPKPATGNAGGIAHVADDDGGYLRACAIRYYQQPLPLRPSPAKPIKVARVAPARVTSALAPRPPVSAPPIPVAGAIVRWDAILRERISISLRARREPHFTYHLGAAALPARLSALSPDGATLVVLESGGNFSVPWEQLKLTDRHNLARELQRDRDSEDAALVAFYALATGQDASKELVQAGSLAIDVHASFVAAGDKL